MVRWYLKVGIISKYFAAWSASVGRGPSRKQEGPSEADTSSMSSGQDKACAPGSKENYLSHSMPNCASTQVRTALRDFDAIILGNT
eukprot:225566-Pelagomonas_calceolata.AAC.5